MGAVTPPFYPKKDFTLKARRMLELMGQGALIASAGSSPTITEGTSGANSTFVTGNDLTHATVLPLSGQVSLIGQPLVSGNGGAPYTQTPGYKASNGLIGYGSFAYRFGTDAPAFDFSCFTTDHFRVKVNGLWTTEFTTSNDGNQRYIKVDFGSAAVREIELWLLGNCTSMGFNVAAGYNIWPSPLNGPNGVFWGDSYAQSVQWTSSPTDTIPNRLMELCGFPIAGWGMGGQGAVKTDATFSKTLLDRANAGDFAAMGQRDLIILYSSLNDTSANGVTSTQIKTNWQTIIARAMVDQPNALIYGFAGFQAASYPMDTAHNQAFLDAFNAVKDPRRMRADDMFTTQPLITLTGGNANVSKYIGADSIHPNAAGAIYDGSRIKGGRGSFLQSIA